MTFPTTSIIDTFNRADESPLGTASDGETWSAGDIGDGGAKLKIVSNAAAVQFAIAIDNSQSITTAKGPDSEAYATITVLTSDYANVYARLNGTGALNGYLVKANVAGGVSQILRLDSGSVTQLGSAVSVTWSAGDAVGIEVVGSSISSYRKPGAGAWGLVDSEIDATYSAAGWVGCALRDTAGTARLDDFGGGTIVVPGASWVPASARVQFT